MDKDSVVKGADWAMNLIDLGQIVCWSILVMAAKVLLVAGCVVLGLIVSPFFLIGLIAYLAGVRQVPLYAGSDRHRWRFR